MLRLSGHGSAQQGVLGLEEHPGRTEEASRPYTHCLKALLLSSQSSPTAHTYDNPTCLSIGSNYYLHKIAFKDCLGGVVYNGRTFACLFVYKVVGKAFVCFLVILET